MALKLDILANTRQYVSEMKKAGASTDEIAEALQWVSKEGDAAGSNLEAEFRDIVQSSRKAERAVADIGDKGFREAGASTGAFKDEAVQNFSEVASSFSGDITEMADGVQGLTGGLASALTPGIGIPIAILGAAAGAFLQSWIDSSEESKERVNSMYQDMLESGNRFVSDNFVNDAIATLGEDQGKVNEAVRLAALYRTDESDVLRAMVGDAEALGRVQADALTTHRQEVTEIQNSAKGEREKADLIDAANVKYEASVDWIKQIQSDTAAARTQWEAINGALIKTNDDAKKLNDTVFTFKQSVKDGITIPVRVDDTNLRNYKPPKIYVPGTIVMPGQRQIVG